MRSIRFCTHIFETMTYMYWYGLDLACHIFSSHAATKILTLTYLINFSVKWFFLSFFRNKEGLMTAVNSDDYVIDVIRVRYTSNLKTNKNNHLPFRGFSFSFSCARRDFCALISSFYENIFLPLFRVFVVWIFFQNTK